MSTSENMHIDAESAVTRVFDLLFTNMGPHDPLLSHMDARELLAFSQTCGALYSLVKTTAFNLPRLLSPFFGHATEVDRFRRMQLQTGTLISGGIALQFFHRLRWLGADLDLYVHGPTAAPAVRFLVSNGYKYNPRASQLREVFQQMAVDPIHPDRDPDLPPGYKRGIVDVLDFSKGDKKIQLIIAAQTPMQIIMKFHSTCVMNVISHEKAYALYPSSTFIAHEALILKSAGSGPESTSSREAGRQKYIDRGWSMVKQPSAVREELEHNVVRWMGDHFTWTIPLPPLLVPVPDLCALNSWCIEPSPESAEMSCEVFSYAGLQFNYIKAVEDRVYYYSAMKKLRSSGAPTPLDAQLAQVVTGLRLTL
ncbi:hypothetical protein B0H16DRAFT_1419574 [Mycena metata]|uniref:Uncharacterized protein n=1 Tax=Mycena metata TaxID=1033252 RepID=A0AAD7N8D2_9AGAR|nr:hypothetical protein B0H16DRAFT_1419574 [Mycena metata]